VVGQVDLLPEEVKEVRNHYPQDLQEPQILVEVVEVELIMVDLVLL
jgi:hypothetical protein